MGSLLLKNPSISPSRRQSKRLKKINAIYKSEDVALCSKFQHQTSEESIPHVTDQVKLEKMLLDCSPSISTDHFQDSTGSERNESYMESNGVCDDLTIDSMTLKDMQASIKAKREVLKPVASPDAVLKSEETDFKVKLEEEELDLEEPLINLKLRLSKASSTKRKRRKDACYSSSAAQGFLSVVRDPTTDRFSSYTATNLLESKNLSERTEENCGAITKKLFMEVDDSLVSSATNMQTDAISGESVSNVRSEKVETCCMDGETNKDAVTSIPELVEKYNFLRCSFSEPYQVNEEVFDNSGVFQCSGVDGPMKMDLHKSSSESEMERSLQENPELVCNLKPEGLVTNSLVCQNTVYISASSNADFIASYGYPENSSAGVLERVEAASIDHILCKGTHALGEVSSSVLEVKCLTDLVQETPADMVPNNNGKNQANPELVCNLKPEGLVTNSLVCQNTVYISASSNADFIASYGYPENSSAGVLERVEAASIDHILCKGTHALGEVSSSVLEVKCLIDLVQETPADMVPNNNGKNHAIPCLEEHSRTKTTCFSVPTDLHPVEEGPYKTEKLSSSVEPMLTDSTNKAICCSPEISNSIDAGGIAESCHCGSQNSHCSFSAVDGLLQSDNDLDKATEKLSSSPAAQWLDASADNISTSTSCSVDTEGHYSAKEQDPPIKILSNRKTLSPASQEKLHRALNDDGLYDAMKHSVHPEAAAALGHDRMLKKPKFNTNGSLPPFTKGVLKSPEASCRTFCSCNKGSRIQIQTEEAIRFSLRQMQDIKSISAKLLNGMNSMKNIVEDTLFSEACSSVPSKYTAEEIRMATEQASDLEATTKKWLSIMSKDCNRFCKILRTSDNNATSANVVRKQRKKIIFADEAGGLLCHVKVFDQQPASFGVSENDKANQ